MSPNMRSAGEAGSPRVIRVTPRRRDGAGGWSRWAPGEVPGGDKTMKHRYIAGLVALILAASPTVGIAQPLYQLSSLPADTVLKVRLDDTLGSGSSRPGDRFTATVEDPSFPSGALVRGVVTDVRPADS